MEFVFQIHLLQTVEVRNTVASVAIGKATSMLRHAMWLNVNDTCARHKG